MAETVVSTLAQLASTGRIVVASLHCPSSDVMAHISHLMLLTYDGRVAYHGPRTEAVGHFVSAGSVAGLTRPASGRAAAFTGQTSCSC